MYESFFSLKKKPFELVPDPDFMYLSRSYKKALIYLDYGIRERAGFILLTGEVGTGKTTLIRDLLNRKYDKVVLAKVFNTRVSCEQLLAIVNYDFGLPAAAQDKVSLLKELNDFLLEQYALGKQPILVIDEAQNLGADLLEEIRMLSNLESVQSKLLQIVLVGQPELRVTLASPGLLQLRQRISINCHLSALTREETAQYIEHRMTVAGNPGALLLDGETLDLMQRYSKGVPRLINICCDFILLSAFANQSRTVSGALVRDVIGELEFESHSWDASAPVAAELPPAELPLGQAAQPAPGTLPLLEELTRRVESMERDVSQQVSPALQEFCDSIASLRGEFSAQADRQEAQAGRQEAQVAELRRKLESLSLVVDRFALEAPHIPSPPTGFGRRILARISGCCRKK